MLVQSQNLRLFKCTVSQHIVMMEHPIASVPQFRLFAPNVLPQMPQNVAVELGTDSPTLGDKFMVHTPTNVEENDKHALGHALDLPRLLWSWRVRALPLQRLLSGLWVVALDPTLITVMILDTKVGHHGPVDRDPHGL